MESVSYAQTNKRRILGRIGHSESLWQIALLERSRSICYFFDIDEIFALILLMHLLQENCLELERQTDFRTPRKMSTLLFWKVINFEG